MATLSPWEKFSRDHRQDERFTAVITAIVDFGIFIGLEGDIDGLVHLSDISWFEPGETAIERYVVGDQIEVSILAIDVDRQRISLGIKQCAADNPWQTFADQYDVGDQVVGNIREIHERILVVDLPGGVTGKVHLPKSSVEQFGLGDEIDLVILEISLRHGLIELGLIRPGDGPSTQEVRPDKPTAPKPLASVVSKP